MSPCCEELVARDLLQGTCCLVRDGIDEVVLRKNCRSRRSRSEEQMWPSPVDADDSETAQNPPASSVHAPASASGSDRPLDFVLRTRTTCTNIPNPVVVSNFPANFTQSVHFASQNSRILSLLIMLGAAEEIFLSRVESSSISCRGQSSIATLTEAGRNCDSDHLRCRSQTPPLVALKNVTQYEQARRN